jgi:plasmid stability protein
VRDVADDLVAKLKQRAASKGRSVEAEHREILRLALEGDPSASFDTPAEELRRLTAGRSATPAEVLLREGRDER